MTMIPEHASSRQISFGILACHSRDMFSEMDLISWELQILKEAQFCIRWYVQCLLDDGIGARSFLLLWTSFQDTCS